MQRVTSGGLGRGHDRLDIEIGARALPRDLVSNIRRTDMQRERVVGRVDRDGGKAGFVRGARDANGDLATVGDQQFLEGHG